MHRFALASAIVVVLVCGVAATRSDATPPGKNGRIAFRRWFDAAHTTGAVFTIDADGSGETQITRPPKLTVDDQPDWAPGGSLITFSRCRVEAACSVYTVRPDGSRLSRISTPCPLRARPPRCADETLPTFSPDGRGIAFGSRRRAWSDLVVADLGTGVRRVVEHGSPASSISDPQFSPSGKRLVFVEARTASNQRQAIFVANVDGTDKRRLTPWSLGAGDNEDWSPDGSWILFRSHEDGNGQSQLYLVHPDGTGLKQLTRFGDDTIVTSSSFSPDGRWIVFASTGVGGNADLYVMRPDGSDSHPITRTKRWESAPDWGSAPS
jgi:TolB protein